MYSTSLFDGNILKGDMGGNKIPIDCPYSEGKNLHALWDDMLGLYKYGRRELPLKEKDILDLDVIVEEAVSKYPKSFYGELIKVLKP